MAVDGHDGRDWRTSAIQHRSINVNRHAHDLLGNVKSRTSKGSNVTAGPIRIRRKHSEEMVDARVNTHQQTNWDLR